MTATTILPALSNRLFQRAAKQTYQILTELEPRITDRGLWRELHAYRLYLGQRLRMPDLPHLRLEEVPDIAGLTDASFGTVAVEVLRRGPNPMDAVDYAYRLYRAFPDDARAWMAVISSANLGQLPHVTFPKHTAVESGTAVQFVEHDTLNREWIIVADDASLSQNLQERRPNDPLIQTILGKKPGEQFELRSVPKPARTGTILAVQSKYEYRCRYCLENAERRFGRAAPVMAFHVPEDDTGKLNGAVLLDQMKGLFEGQDEALEEYERLPLPIHVVSARYGTTAFEGIQCLASGAGKGPKCVLGTAPEVEAATDAMRISRAVVLDETALGTLFLLHRCKVSMVAQLLGSIPHEMIISEFALTAMKQEVDSKWSSVDDSRFLGVVGGQLVLQEVPKEVAEKGRNTLADFINCIESHCKVVARTPDQALLSEDTEILRKAFGSSGLHAMQLARSSGSLLWTDDLVMGMIAASDWSLRRVWTQVIYNWLSNKGNLAREIEEEASLRLLSMNYRFTSIAVRHFARAGTITGWNPDEAPLSRVLEEFANTAIDLASLARMLSGSLVALWRTASLDASCQAVTLRLLSSVARRPGGDDLIRQLRENVDLVFGLDVVNAQHVQTIITGWLNTRRGIIVP